jgi:exodeoxyribonuclease VII small subunit
MARKEAAEASIESLSFEQAFRQLEHVVAQLEQGDLPLDQSLELYARGRRLVERCTQLLDQAELQVREVKS